MLVKLFAGFGIAYTFLYNGKSLKRWITRKIVVFIEDVTELFFPVYREEDSIDGIPHSELIHHLFTEKSFKRDDIEDRFLLPRYKVQEMGENMERVNILVRGENNARVLNEELSRSDVASIIRSAKTTKELRPLFRKKDRGFTSSPSAEQIKEELDSLATESHATGVQPMYNEGATGVQPPIPPLGFTSRAIVSA